MSQAVIDELEVIEIDEHDSDRMNFTLRENSLPQPVVQQIAIRQTRERIVVRLMLELLLVALALDRILHRAHEKLALELPFEEVILRAGFYRGECKYRVVIARKNDDRHLGRVRVHLRKRLQAVAIRQGQIEQQEIDWLRRQDLDRARQAVGAGHPERRGRM